MKIVYRLRLCPKLFLGMKLTLEAQLPESFRSQTGVWERDEIFHKEYLNVLKIVYRLPLCPKLFLGMKLTLQAQLSESVRSQTGVWERDEGRTLDQISINYQPSIINHQPSTA